jgi:hypothetical protein
MTDAGQIPPPPPPAPIGPGPAPIGYPIGYEVELAPERSRLSVFFRLILAIPWFILAYIYEFIGVILVVIAWFAILITGRYPHRLYDWNAGILRFYGRAAGFVLLATDNFPPIGWADDADQAQRVLIAPRPESQSRLKTLFRLILVIPLVFVSYGLNWIMIGSAVTSWFTIVFRGYQPQGVHNALVFSLKWHLRLMGYVGLLTDVYPPVDDNAPKLAQAG